MKKKLLIGSILVMLLVPVSCTAPPLAPMPAPEPAPAPTPIEELVVKDALDARDASLKYLQEHEGNNTPSKDTVWQEEEVTPPGLVGSY